jgi:hypothetical protein
VAAREYWSAPPVDTIANVSAAHACEVKRPDRHAHILIE